jgi:hypothetical protein
MQTDAGLLLTAARRHGISRAACAEPHRPAAAAELPLDDHTQPVSSHLVARHLFLEGEVNQIMI